jgi:hypothetical protein
MTGDTPPAALKRQTCTDHCAACDSHFHGLSAFDLHQQGGYCHEPAEVTLRSGKRKGESALRAWTHEGSCDKSDGCWQDGKRVRWEHPVSVWQRATDDNPRERLHGLTRKDSAAVTPEAHAEQARLAL